MLQVSVLSGKWRIPGSRLSPRKNYLFQKPYPMKFPFLSLIMESQKTTLKSFHNVSTDKTAIQSFNATGNFCGRKFAIQMPRRALR